jgi:DNA polymerase III epsilon subunit-like protein
VSGVCFIDTETTGLDPDLHEIWEVGLIVDDQEYEWMLPVDLGRADPIVLKIGRFFERRVPYLGERTGWNHGTRELWDFAQNFALLTRGRHLVGAVVSFDEERLRKLLQANGACPGWHYHIIDVEALAIGYVSAAWAFVDEPVGSGPLWQFDPHVLPWKSDDLSRAIGVEPPGEDERHTALGDARWAKRLYEAIVGSG